MTDVDGITVCLCKRIYDTHMKNSFTPKLQLELRHTYFTLKYIK